MPTCKLCNNIFPNIIIINNKQRRLDRRKTCINCNPIKQFATKPTNSDFICDICNKPYIYMVHKSSYTRCANCIWRLRSNRIKQQCITYKGGQCIICGYNKCARALVFHHLNPSQKLFNISGRHCLSWEKLKPELDKCVLLCCRCHMEIEAGITKLNEDSSG